MVHDLREDERELAGAILEGSKRRTDQAFGDYYRGRNSSCALGAATRASRVCPTRPTASARSGSIACSNASKRGAHLSRMQQEEAAAWRADRAFERRESLDARTHRGVGRRPRRAARRITRPSLMGHFR